MFVRQAILLISDAANSNFFCPFWFGLVLVFLFFFLLKRIFFGGGEGVGVAWEGKGRRWLGVERDSQSGFLRY